MIHGQIERNQGNLEEKNQTKLKENSYDAIILAVAIMNLKNGSKLINN